MTFPRVPAAGRMSGCQLRSIPTITAVGQGRYLVSGSNPDAPLYRITSPFERLS